MLLGPIAITSSLLNSLLILNKVGGLFKGVFTSQFKPYFSFCGKSNTERKKAWKVDRDVLGPVIVTKRRLKL